jgi:hypothetical protein
MIAFDPELVRSFADKVVFDIKQSMDVSGVTASGKFNRSLDANVTDKEVLVTGLKYAGAIESGRKPSSGGTGILRALIRSWIDDKGIIPTGGISKDSLAYLITRKIHQEGTRLYNGTDFYGRSKPSRVIRGVVKDGRIEELGSDLMINYVKQIKSELFDGINSNG